MRGLIYRFLSSTPKECVDGLVVGTNLDVCIPTYVYDNKGNSSSSSKDLTTFEFSGLFVSNVFMVLSFNVHKAWFKQWSQVTTSHHRSQHKPCDLGLPISYSLTK